MSIKAGPNPNKKKKEGKEVSDENTPLCPSCGVMAPGRFWSRRVT